jgi:two-component system, cell cycle response regulator
MQIKVVQRTLKSRDLPRSFWYSVAFIVLYSLVYDGIEYVHREDFSPSFLFISNMMMMVAIFASFGLSLIGVKRNLQRHHEQFVHPLRQHTLLAPLMVSAALLGQCLTNVLFAYSIVTHTYTFPSWGDAMALTLYPTFILTIWFLPTRSLSRETVLRFLLDSFILILCLLTFSWYFILGPMLLVNGQSPFIKFAHVAYPAGEFVMISCLILFTINMSGRLLRLAVIFLFTGTLAYLFPEVIRQYAYIHSILTLPWWIFTSWVEGCFFFALAAQVIHCLPVTSTSSEAQKKQKSPSSIPLWRVLLPYAFIPAVIVLLFYVWSTDKRIDLLSIGTYSCGISLLILIFIRQVLTLRESHQLNHYLQAANGRLEALATTDPLTELPNHRALMTALTSELERAERFQRSCTLLFFDIDHFKALNDGYGHAAGDEVLATFGQRLCHTVRKIDTVGRWGGEEFLALLPETTIQEAQDIAERILKAVGQQAFPIGGGLYITCSIGVASYPIHAEALNDLVNAADQAMYAAKRLGRNQYRVIDDQMVQLLLVAGSSEGSREEATTDGCVAALTSMIRQHNAGFADHAADVAQLVERLALRMGLSSNEAHMVSLAGMLHNIGKIGIPEAILQKPARLTPAEWQEIQQYPGIGAEIVTHIPLLRPLAPIIQAHHEWWNGDGYPDHLQGEAIPVAARLIFVTDAYLAMISDRPYRRARSPEEAQEELRKCAGTQFDASMVELLITFLHEEQTPQRSGRSLEHV